MIVFWTAAANWSHYTVSLERHIGTLFDPRGSVKAVAHIQPINNKHKTL